MNVSGNVPGFPETFINVSGKPGTFPETGSDQNKKEDVHGIGNYCPICLLSVVYELFTRVILNRISRTLDEGQPCEEAGFRRGFSTIDQIHTITAESGTQARTPRVTQAVKSYILVAVELLELFEAQFLPAAAFVSYKMKNVRPDVEEGKGIAQRLSCYRLPSNLIVSQLMNVIAVEHDNGAFDSVTLDKTDEERETVLEQRKKARDRWTILARGALQRALYDIRKYVIDENGRRVSAPVGTLFIIKSFALEPSQERADARLTRTTTKKKPNEGKTTDTGCFLTT
ncbi:unnamed protein product [Heligmosomoides polygyrus]|uniref:Reverse transcriptase domain-containing protein n=1 Tax=Heligmosomoides polygyrus TaxID=6339 RepID=A0A183FLW0_HELPZ|nr:unnamed protein product [Heligmosomoides polygyrus]